MLGRVSTELVVLYDADHHADVDSLLLLIRALEEAGPECVAVQGSTYIRDTSARDPLRGALARLISAEFFVTHFVYFRAMQVRLLFTLLFTLLTLLFTLLV